ncbi:protein DpdG [Caballeronia sp. Lep1P3]|uniref:protein DpdG n=1 Tax=Caballeronia sp. Lep1P3 TaxID=2878150 RepID=UPI001FD07971|nr:protein DpdG [Caballeronia sp. Lep1P3]
MSITNLASDGLHAHMIVLARALSKQGPLTKDDLISVCAPPADDSGKEPELNRLRASLGRWTEIGLFSNEHGVVRITTERQRGETIDEWTERLPAICRRLMLRPEHCLPLWEPNLAKTEEGAGRVADFTRALSWALAQDIYSLPNINLEQVERAQVLSPYFIIMNFSNRLPGFRAWARYLGFATGGDNNFFVDPTEAVRAELEHVLTKETTTLANTFVDALAERIPVVDRGEYRRQVEETLKPSIWRRVPSDHLSMSLSLALRRLELDGTIALERRADAGSTLSLTGRAYRTWGRFTHVRLLGDAN